MAWPPTSSATSFLVQGVTGVKIGVEGIVQTPIPATTGLKYFTVLKVDQKTLADVMKCWMGASGILRCETIRIPPWVLRWVPFGP